MQDIPNQFKEINKNNIIHVYKDLQCFPKQAGPVLITKAFITSCFPWT